MKIMLLYYMIREVFMSKNKHGANLFELSQKYGFNIEDIMDFSSNINPF